jgi:hypothetical protein
MLDPVLSVDFRGANDLLEQLKSTVVVGHAIAAAHRLICRSGPTPRLHDWIRGCCPVNLRSCQLVMSHQDRSSCSPMTAG